MTEDRDSTERGYSKELDSDAESRDESNPPGKPGRKKNPNSQAARRDQNRIAQREFRLRKQQRIRDLEARVEILSGGKDEALGEMRNILKDLMQENQTLRNLLRSLAGFIGDGAGGLLPKLGWEMSDFNNFINRSETDTAWEGYQRRKKATASAEVLLNSGQKRSAEDEPASASKKPRTSDASETYPMLLPLNHQSPPNMYSARTHESSSGGMFPDMLRNGNSSSSPMFMQPPPSSSTPPSYGPQSSSTTGPYQAPYLPSGPMGIDTALPPLNFPPSSSVSSSRPAEQPSPEQLEDDEDPNKNEAYKLIHYHLDNFKRNSAYCLPSSLRPTLVQRTVPHESVIDRILHPELRDRMILLRTRFDLVDCLLEYRNNVTIHGDDVLAHSNWEISEKWLRKYNFLVEPATLSIMNRWRRERGEPELRLSDLTGSDTPSST
ncbi:hypothetical protein VNI00_005705 [Paramarasmius palmivorus]|uniref:BZIP domain-containing protein n=1 Tax=Paramarasmius palmivorus TaxID=297713 RepID=A0AAW0DG84_9AGAR